MLFVVCNNSYNFAVPDRIGGGLLIDWVFLQIAIFMGNEQIVKFEMFIESRMEFLLKAILGRHGTSEQKYLRFLHPVERCRVTSVRRET